MKQIFLKVKAFQLAFGSKIHNKPTMLDVNRGNLRWALMDEENAEYHEAIQAGNLTEVADALGDMLYILAGTILEHGMQHVIEKVFDEIHNSNMSKLDQNGKAIINGENGIYDSSRPLGKILKSENFFKPDVEAAMRAGTNEAIRLEKSLHRFKAQAEGFKKASMLKETELVYEGYIEKFNQELEYLTK
jgi:predicted HAD superfamily Cof-like phosphohydrolase